MKKVIVDDSSRHGGNRWISHGKAGAFPQLIAQVGPISPTILEVINNYYFFDFLKGWIGINANSKYITYREFA